MQRSVLKSSTDNEKYNRNCVIIIGIVYFIILFWAIVFKCNYNKGLHVDLNRSRTILERLVRGFTTDPIKAVMYSIKSKKYVELCAVIFNVVGLIPMGILFRCCFKRAKAILYSFLVKL